MTSVISEDKVEDGSVVKRGGAKGSPNYQKFVELAASDIDAQVGRLGICRRCLKSNVFGYEQVEFFLKSFIFNLGDEWSNVPALSQKFREYLKEKAEKHDLDAAQAADFLQVWSCVILS